VGNEREGEVYIRGRFWKQLGGFGGK